MKDLEEQSSDNNTTKYGTFTLPSDSFARSFLKQKDYNEWILTVTFSDPDGYATSKFHIYLLAAVESSRNHQTGVGHYLKEIEELKNGAKRFWGIG